MRSFLFSLLLLGLVTGCGSEDTVDSSKVDESTFHRLSTVTYDRANQQLAILVQFRVAGSGGTTVRLSNPSKLSVGGEEMIAVDERLSHQPSPHPLMRGTFYRLVKKIPEPQENYQITWTRKDGSPESWNLAMPRTTEPLIAKNLSSRESLEIAWEGEPLASNEQVEAKMIITSVRKDNGSSTERRREFRLENQARRLQKIDVLETKRNPEVVPQSIELAIVRKLTHEKTDRVNSYSEVRSASKKVTVID